MAHRRGVAVAQRPPQTHGARASGASSLSQRSDSRQSNLQTRHDGVASGGVRCRQTQPRTQTASVGRYPVALVLVAVVTAANLPERDGARLVFAWIRHRFARLLWIWVDGGYAGADFGLWVMQTYHWLLRVVRRPDAAKGFVKLPVRWRVERTFGWLNWCRRFSKDYEVLPETHEALVYAAMVRLMVRRLA